MDPLIGSSLIKVGGSLLGGLFGKKEEKYVVPDYAGIRRASEAAGFNPLTALTQGPQGSVVQTGGQMGQAISDAALLLADDLKGREEDKLRLENLRMQNEKLKQELTDATIRPTIGGVYAQRESVGGAVKTSPFPLKSPRDRMAEMIPVRNPSGGWGQISRGTAERLNIRPFGQLLSSDYEEIAGEVGGQFYSIPHQPNIPGAIFGGFGNPLGGGNDKKNDNVFDLGTIFINP